MKITSLSLVRGNAAHFALAALILLLPALAQAAPYKRPAEDNLERVLANSRREQVKSVNYALHFTFRKGQDEYAGHAVITADLSTTKMPLSLDWLGKAPDKISVNGEEIKDFKTQTGSLEIPAAHLKPKTEISIEFTNTFSKEGDGIQHVVDPEDKAEYVYTDFEPYHAHELFPCFDQPDLKAHFDLTISAPSEWKAIGNELVDTQKTEGDLQVTRFKTTPLLSTYLFFVGAGPYQEWKDSEGTTPIYIYARKSLARYVDVENIFTTSKKGLRFYSGYFGFAYPFSKFGLLFAPEFGWGGMENPGAIVANERNLFRGPVPKSRRDGRDSLILHEMAHMWFGDLVTMRWWNDLWLNESFATYMATIAQDRALGTSTAWQDFAGGKGWGYWQDQLVTTHPIETEVKDVRTARGNFDGITYAKGGAALEQLHFFVGEDGFQSGVQDYFRQHAFGNAEREDFVGAIAASSHKNLNAWTHAWLQTAGLNRVSAKWACQNGELSSFSLLQEPSSSHTLSPHRTRVGFFHKENGELKLIKSVDAAFSAKATKVSLDAAIPCPDFVYPNLDDKDYALYSIDETSLKNTSLVLGGGVKDPLLRLLVWNTLYQMVRDAQLTPARYFELASAGLSQEDDDNVLANILGKHSQLKDAYHQYLSPQEREQIAPAFETAIWNRVLGADKGSSRQMTFFDFYSKTVQSKSRLADLRTMLEKNTPPAGIELDQDRRWAILLNLARHGDAKASTLVEAESARDPSDSGRRFAYSSRVATPAMDSKKQFWKAVESPEKIPPSTLRMAAEEFHQPDDLKLSEYFVKEYFQRLKKINWKKSDQLVEVYFESLFPRNLCSKTLLVQSQAELKSATNLTPLARRSWLEGNDELARCVKISSHR